MAWHMAGRSLLGNGLHQKIVTDLIDGKLKGTRGVSLTTKGKMEEVFGKIFGP